MRNSNDNHNNDETIRHRRTANPIRRLTRASTWTAAAASLVVGAAVWAQTTGGGRAATASGDAAMASVVGSGRPSLLDQIVSTLVFGLVGVLLLIVGFKVFDLVIRHNIEHEIFENKNMAAAVLSGFIVLGVALVVAATILAD